MSAHFTKRNHILAAIVAIEKLIASGVIGLESDRAELIRKFNTWRAK